MLRILPVTTIIFHIVYDRPELRSMLTAVLSYEVQAAEIRLTKSFQIWAWARCGAKNDNFREDIYFVKFRNIGLQNDREKIVYP